MLIRTEPKNKRTNHVKEFRAYLPTTRFVLDRNEHEIVVVLSNTHREVICGWTVEVRLSACAFVSLI